MDVPDIGIIVALMCILLLSLVGNVALLAVVFSQLPYQLVKNYSYLILNLAISDILLAISSIPFDIAQKIKRPEFPFGAAMCKILWPLQTVCGMSSIFTVGALSYHRYRLVVRPFNGKIRRRFIVLIIISIWVLPVILAGAPYSFALRFDPNTSSCNEEWAPATEKAKLGFTTYLFVIQYVLPLALIVWCNVNAILELKRHLKDRTGPSVINDFSIDNHEKTVKMLTAIMAVFALFWLPGQTMALLMAMQYSNEFMINYGLDIAYILVFSNCVLNPFIFAYFSQCHKNLPILRRFTASSINPTNASDVNYFALRRRSDQRKRSDSLPENCKTLPLRKRIKRTSLPTILYPPISHKTSLISITGSQDDPTNKSKSYALVKNNDYL